MEFSLVPKDGIVLEGGFIEELGCRAQPLYLGNVSAISEAGQTCKNTKAKV